MATVIMTNGLKKDLGEGRVLTLEEIQKEVEGYFTTVSVYGSKDMVILVNEEGLLKNLPMNIMATAMAGKMIVGNVIVAKLSEIN